MATPENPYGRGSDAAAGHGDRPGYDPGAAGPGPYSAPAQPTNWLGVTALVLGLAAVLLFWTIAGGILLGLLAIVAGVLARRRVKRGQATNGGVALAGLILGVVGLLLGGLVLAGFGALLNRGDVQELRQCVEQAGNDEAARQQCQREFENQQRR